MSAVAVEDDLYADDPAHPLAFLGVLDAHELFENQSCELSIIVRGPMAADIPSQQRLIRKIEGYLALLDSEDFQEQCGPPNPERTRVLVVIPYDSDPLIFELLERCQQWVLEAGASLVIERIRWRADEAG